MKEFGYCLLIICSVALYFSTEDSNLLAGGVSGLVFGMGAFKLIFTELGRGNE